MNATLQQITDFIESIGIRTVFRTVETACFLPGISIEQGELHIDKEKLSYPGDLLHEAGHIAVVPLAERASLNAGSIAERKDHGAEEMMAIAWSYAASTHLGIDPKIVFHEHGYKGGNESLIQNFQAGRVLGLPMLQYIGLAYDAPTAAAKTTQPYPYMQRWTRA